MPKSVFTFKEFTVNQDKCPMKINTDAVLIGAWTNPAKAKTILDIGTGTGIIALMLAQRSLAKIDAIDIEGRACEQAEGNFLQSQWNKRLNVFHTPLQNFYPKKKYDLIISNPPYFPCPQTHAGKEGSEARFTHKLSFYDLAEHAVRLLSSNGSFYVVFPVHEGAFFTNEAEKRKLFLTDYVWIKTTTNKKFPKRILMQFKFSKTLFQAEDKVLVIQNEKNKYTKEYKALTKDYYLHF